MHIQVAFHNHLRSVLTENTLVRLTCLGVNFGLPTNFFHFPYITFVIVALNNSIVAVDNLNTVSGNSQSSGYLTLSQLPFKVKNLQFCFSKKFSYDFSAKT